jgi:L-amino acid N-acyltransferase YncA
MGVLIRSLDSSDWPRVSQIYLEGIETGQATFETKVPEWDKWNAAHTECCRLVATIDAEVVGWAALSRVSVRDAYRGVAEVSVYVSAAKRGQGIGRNLLESLIIASEGNEFWTLQATVFPENEASIALHLSCGFRIVGKRERIASLHGVWRDTCLLERRSRVVQP